MWRVKEKGGAGWGYYEKASLINIKKEEPRTKQRERERERERKSKIYM